VDSAELVAVISVRLDGWMSGEAFEEQKCVDLGAR
jgi:hypothetical protein